MSHCSFGHDHPLPRLEAGLAAGAPMGELLALQFEVLQHLKVGLLDPAQAEPAFQRLVIRCMDNDGAALQALLEEPRAIHLPPASQRTMDCLRLILEGRITEATARLPQLRGPQATSCDRLVASRLLLRRGRVSESLMLLQSLLDDRAIADGGYESAMLQNYLHRRIKQRPSASRPLLTLCAAVRNEAHHVAEWIAFHALIGVEAFRIYENESTDGTLEVLRRLARHYPIEVVPWVQQPANITGYQDVIEHHAGSTDWLACLDADEFLIPAAGQDLRAILRRAPDDVAAITVNWRIFGSSGRRNRSPGLTLESYERRAPDGFQPNRHVKSIIRPSLVAAARNQHEFITVARQVDGALAETFVLAGQQAPRFDVLSVHHYVIRSWEDFAIKRARGRGENAADGRPAHLDEGFFHQYDRNEVEDRSAWRFLPALRSRLAEVV